MVLKVLCQEESRCYNNNMVFNEHELMKYGEQLGRELLPGSVVALIGDLGAGKTTMAKAIAKGLGVVEDVTSPTFTIINEYTSGRLPFYHYDVYRLGDGDDAYEGMEELGYKEHFFGDGVTVVEWADIIEDLLPKDATYIMIENGGEDDTREVRIL